MATTSRSATIAATETPFAGLADRRSSRSGRLVAIEVKIREGHAVADAAPVMSSAQPLILPVLAIMT